jgi:rhodanese-related sulfurtransferase
MRVFTTLSLLLSFLWGCTSGKTESMAYNWMLSRLLAHSVQEISVDEASKEVEQVFLDARSWEEYHVSRIPGALWVDFPQLNSDALSSLSCDTPLVVYCSVGYRSEKMAEQLLAQGFTQVSNLYGGIFEWVNQGHTVVDAQGTSTPTVHAFEPKWGVWLKKGQKTYGLLSEPH